MEDGSGEVRLVVNQGCIQPSHIEDNDVELIIRDVRERFVGELLPGETPVVGAEVAHELGKDEHSNRLVLGESGARRPRE